MKIKKVIILIILLALFCVPFVNAEECDVNSITIEEINLKDKTMATNEIEEPTFDGRNIDLNLSMVSVGDSITYSILVKNSSDKDYELDKDSFKIDSNYLDYSIESDDNLNFVKANSTKIVNLKVTYSNSVPPGDYNDGAYNLKKDIDMNFSNDNEPALLSAIKNPDTNVGTTIVIGIVVVISTLIIMGVLKRKKMPKYYLIIIPMLALIPICVYALCTCKLKVGSNVTIYQRLINTLEQKTEGTISPGDEISIANQEHFYVVSSDESKTVLLAKYNLYVGEIFLDSEYKGRIGPKETYYGLQDRQTLFKSVVGETREVGLVPFSSSTYWLDEENNIDPKYGSSSQRPMVGVNIFDHEYDTEDFEFDKTTLGEDGHCINGMCKSTDSNYSIAYYINNYKKKLEEMGLRVDEVRLLNDTEAANLGCPTGNANYAKCPTNLKWLNDGKYWIDGLYFENSPRLITRGQMFSGTYNHIEAGVRPVIVINTDMIPLLSHDYFVNKPEVFY